MRCTMIAVFLAAPVIFVVGCGPSWHSGDERFTLRHGIHKAEVHDDNLIVMGIISPLVAVTDYGVKVFSAKDDTGRELPFKSFQIFYAKGMWFSIELGAPNPKAKSVSLDMAFTSRSGLQRIRQKLPIARGVNDSWRTGRQNWEEQPNLLGKQQKNRR